MLTELEKNVIASLEGDIPVTERPFLELAEQIGIPEEQFLEILSDLKERGIIRRFGATLKHQNSGYKANAMVAWKVPEEQAQKVGHTMASFSEVTHCYRRDPAPGWEFNVYTMVHAPDEETCRAVVRKISNRVEQTDYTILFSKRELKKTSMKYFS
ncbi:MAG: Lrp/AsnC family transcriptional regulator [Desulfarculaceae bacterium]|nr:Lrp/AsnC family transcriptional regulator [Desulfarculaceae bacterium]